MHLDDQYDLHSVVVVGAGVSGLSLAIELARLHNNNTHDGKKLDIILIEASAWVGGRVRTICTNCKNETASSRFLALAPSRQEYWKKRYEKFYPWSIPLGAEFVHGDQSNPTVMDRILCNQSKQQQQQQQRRNESNTSHMSLSQNWEMELVVIA